MNGYHMSRSWKLEDPYANDSENPCGCGTAPCGGVDGDKLNPECKQHNGRETIRNGHAAETCPVMTQEATDEQSS